MSFVQGPLAEFERYTLYPARFTSVFAFHDSAMLLPPPLATRFTGALGPETGLMFVTRYVDFSPDNNKYCSLLEDVRAYCHPNVYKGVTSILYRNNGDGTFTDISKEAGVLPNPSALQPIAAPAR